MWQLDLSEDFDARQLVLRTNLRVKNSREEPIDYLAKVILTCFGQLPASLAFCSPEHPELSLEFRKPY